MASINVPKSERDIQMTAAAIRYALRKHPNAGIECGRWFEKESTHWGVVVAKAAEIVAAEAPPAAGVAAEAPPAAGVAAEAPPAAGVAAEAPPAAGVAAEAPPAAGVAAEAPPAAGVAAEAPLPPSPTARAADVSPTWRGSQGRKRRAREQSSDSDKSAMLEQVG
jgi:hypothetical protein